MRCRLESILVLFLVLTYSASAQTGYGSVVIISFTKSKVIVAADSRASDLSGRKAPDDTHCKLFELGNRIVFASTGAAVRMPNRPTDLAWDNSEIAKIAFQSTRISKGSVAQIAETWGKLVKDN
jgi:hypothetical protein